MYILDWFAAMAPERQIIEQAEMVSARTSNHGNGTNDLTTNAKYVRVLNVSEALRCDTT